MKLCVPPSNDGQQRTKQVGYFVWEYIRHEGNSHIPYTTSLIDITVNIMIFEIILSTGKRSIPCEMLVSQF